MSRPHPPSRSHTYSEVSSSRSGSRSTASSRRSIPAAPSPPSRELVRYASHNAHSSRSGGTRSRVSDGRSSLGLSLNRTNSSPSSRYDDDRPVMQRRATDTLITPGGTSVYKITNNKGTVNINTGPTYIDLGKRQYVSYKDCGNSSSYADNSRREYRESSTHTKPPAASSKGAKDGDGIFDLVEKGFKIVQPFLR